MSDSSLSAGCFFAHFRLSESKLGIPEDSFSGDAKGAPMPYKSISSYGVVGDLHTAALIGLDGSVDWLCLPRFDSPSVFASILDEKRGGQFSIGPVSPEARCQQLYQPETNILVTRFLTLTFNRHRTAQFAVGSTGESRERDAIPRTPVCPRTELRAGRS